MSQISSISQYLHCTPSTHGITRDNHDSSKNMVFIRSQFYCFWFNATFNFIFRMLLAPWECSDVFLTVCFFEFHFASCSQPHLRSRRLPFFPARLFFYLVGWQISISKNSLLCIIFICSHRGRHVICIVLRAHPIMIHHYFIYFFTIIFTSINLGRIFIILTTSMFSMSMLMLPWWDYS